MKKYQKGEILIATSTAVIIFIASFFGAAVVHDEITDRHVQAQVEQAVN